MECLVCRKEFLPRRKSAKFCSAKCRVANSRDTVTSSVTGSPVTDVKDVGVTLPDPYRNMTKDELYAAINSTYLYPQDTWKHSPEFKELKRRLNTLSLEALKKDGYFIPAWKEHGQTDPAVTVTPTTVTAEVIQ